MNHKLGRRKARLQAAASNAHKETAIVSAHQSLPLFHYTTAAGLIGILEDQALWGTHANYLNDTSELRILITLLTPKISQEFRELIPRLKQAGAFLPEIDKAFGESIYDKEAENVCRSVVRSIEKISPLYITSFCLHPYGTEEYEHGLLSQWRGYAQGGFAIEFDELKLDDLTKIECKERAFQMISTRRVSYTDHDTHAHLDRFVGLGKAALRTAFRGVAPALASRPDVAELLGDNDITAYINSFMEVLPFLKSPRFQEENEYRLVAAAISPSKAKADTRKNVDIHFRGGLAGAVVPFIKLFKVANESHLPIKRIIVGPHRDQDNQFNAVRLLLEQQKLDVSVVRSDTTLRF